VLLVAFVRERRRATPLAGEAKARLDLSGAAPTFWMFLGIAFLFALGNSSDTFLILRAKELGLGVTIVVLMYVVYNTTYSLLALPGDRRRPHWEAGSAGRRLLRIRRRIPGFCLDRRG
jgi:hypothetical protein